MNKWYLLVLFVVSNTIIGLNPDNLIKHVKECIKSAYQEKSKLTADVLALEGWSSPKVRHFLNNLCTLPEASYLEVGVYKGSTLISALSGNEVKNAVALDNWSEFSGPSDEFFNNVKRFIPSIPLKFCDKDCFSIDIKQLFDQPINIYFYDGEHSFESQRKAFTYFNDVFDDVFIAVVDDWNWENVKNGTKKAFEELNYTVLFEEALPAVYKIWGDMELWWNGLYVAVIKKK